MQCSFNIFFKFLYISKDGTNLKYNILPHVKQDLDLCAHFPIIETGNVLS